MQLLEDTICQQLLPALTERDIPSDMERELLALPARHGGLGIVNPTTMDEEYTSSLILTAPLTVHILQQNNELGDTGQQQQLIKTTLKAERRRRREEAATEVKARLPKHLQRVAELGSEKGAYSWVTILPITTHIFALHKGAFRDALCLRYNWKPPNLPKDCGMRYPLSLWNMRCHAPLGELQYVDTTRFATSWPISSRMFVMTSP